MTSVIPHIKHGADSITVRGCLGASGPGQIAVTESNMNFTMYQRILEENVVPSVKKLKLNQKWILQQDNDPKHSQQMHKIMTR